MGVHPSLESPAVSGYIIAKPCWARQSALCACHWMWLWVRLSGGWEATVKGFLPGLQQRWQKKQNQRVLESALMWLCKNRIPFSHRTLCWWTVFLAYMLDVLCISLAKTSMGEAWQHGRPKNWASSGGVFEPIALTKLYFYFDLAVHYSSCAHIQKNQRLCRNSSPRPQSISAYEISCNVMNSPKRERRLIWNHNSTGMQPGPEHAHDTS